MGHLVVFGVRRIRDTLFTLAIKLDFLGIYRIWRLYGVKHLLAIIEAGSFTAPALTIIIPWATVQISHRKGPVIILYSFSRCIASQHALLPGQRVVFPASSRENCTCLRRKGGWTKTIPKAVDLSGMLKRLSTTTSSLRGSQI